MGFKSLLFLFLNGKPWQGPKATYETNKKNLAAVPAQLPTPMPKGSDLSATGITDPSTALKHTEAIAYFVHVSSHHREASPPQITKEVTCFLLVTQKVASL